MPLRLRRQARRTSQGSDGRGGHGTSTPVDSVYSGVVSLVGIRMFTFLAELNTLELWSTDIGNAYLESFTKEMVAFVAGPEFDALEGHTFVIVKAIYGLRSSGARWHDRLHDTLQGMGFTPSRADADIWMRSVGDHYEYIAVYVNDLLIASRTPACVIQDLEGNPNSFKLKVQVQSLFTLDAIFRGRTMVPYAWDHAATLTG